MSRIVSANEKSIKEAAEILNGGGLVAIPTETVYGLGANALDGVAVAKIFEAKGRPQFNPLITHVCNVEEAGRYAALSEQAKILAHHFWPGALTMILPRRSDCALSDLVSAGLPTLAIRVPAHKVAREVIKVSGVPIAAPSANISGSLSPTTPMHVAQSLGDKIDMILADGACTVGLESTVVDMSGELPVVLRPGAISAEQISEVLGQEIGYDLGGSADAPKSPGQLLKHYAPSIPVRLNAVDLEAGEALLGFGSDKFMGVKGGGGSVRKLPDSGYKNLSEAGDLHEAAAHLFAMMRMLDIPEHKGIAVMGIPNEGLGIAINDRLKRAAAGSVR